MKGNSPKNAFFAPIGSIATLNKPRPCMMSLTSFHDFASTITSLEGYPMACCCLCETMESANVWSAPWMTPLIMYTEMCCHHTLSFPPPGPPAMPPLTLLLPPPSPLSFWTTLLVSLRNAGFNCRSYKHVFMLQTWMGYRLLKMGIQ